MGIYKNFLTIAFTLIVLHTISGCGDSTTGGGEGNPVAGVPANAITITEDNAQSTASTSADSLDSSDQAGDTILNEEINSLSKRSSFADFAHKIVQSGVIPNANNNLVGVTYNESISCSDPSIGGTGGSISLNGTMDDNTYAFNGSLAFNNCSVDGITVDGTWKIRETCNYDASNDNCSGTITSFSFSITTSIDTIEYANVTISYYDNYNSPYDYRESFSLEISSDFLGGGVLIETTEEFRGYDDFNTGYPDSGQMVITGANGTKARVTALNDVQYSLEVDTGNGYAPHPASPFNW